MSDLIETWRNDFKAFVNSLNLSRDDYMMEYIDELSVVQPDHNADVSKKVEGDCISRQAAVELAMKYCPDDGGAVQCDGDIRGLLDELENLSSAQPEIVRCKDCKWYELPSHKITENCVRWMKRNSILLPIKPDDYCSYAERRTDDTTNKGSSC